MTRRGGFSLLEVLVATAMLLGSVIVLAELASIGRQHIRAADELTRAQLVCQARLEAMLAGALPMTEVEKEPIEDAPGWVATVVLETIDQPGLAALRVTVAQDVPEGERSRECTLVRWVPEPPSFGESGPQGAGASGFDLGPGGFDPVSRAAAGRLP